jgi:hypothetical protein
MNPPHELLFEDWRPSRSGAQRMVSLNEVPGLYGLADQAGSVLFTWNDGGDPVMIVGVGPDWSLATLMNDENLYSYVIDDVEGFVSIDVNGQSCDWPRAELLPRATALPVLLQVPDLAAIRRGFPWLSQWRHLEPEPAPDITQPGRIPPR